MASMSVVCQLRTSVLRGLRIAVRGGDTASDDGVEEPDAAVAASSDSSGDRNTFRCSHSWAPLERRRGYPSWTIERTSHGAFPHQSEVRVEGQGGSGHASVRPHQLR